jgi:hypothetical protein
MRGNVKYQVQRLFAESGINAIGTSRHAAKESARTNGASTSAEVGKNTGIHSYNTSDAYRSVWRQVMNFSRQEFGLKDAEKLESGGMQIRAFLEYKIESGVALATFSQYVAACSKLEQALNLYAEKNNTGRTYDFSSGLVDVRREAHAELRRFDESRAYPAPEKLISALDNSTYRLAASIQLEGATRISETALIRPGQLRGLTTEPVTGREVGAYHVRSKGGHQRTIYIEPQTYRELVQHIRANREFSFNKNDYRVELRQAALLSHQPYSGSHGLRHNAAQRFYAEIQAPASHRPALTSEQALLAASALLGHSRPSIAKVYLR